MIKVTSVYAQILSLINRRDFSRSVTELEAEKGANVKSKAVARLSSAELQNEVHRIVWDDLTEYLKQFSRGTQIVKELERLLIAA